MRAEIKSTGAHLSMRGVTVTGQRTINNTTNYYLINMGTGNASRKAMHYLMQMCDVSQRPCSVVMFAQCSQLTQTVDR